MSISKTYIRLIVPLYLPSACFAIASQALMVLLPLYVVDLYGGTAAAFALASVVVGMRGLGMLFSDIPSGALTTRYGDKPVMLAGAIGVGLCCLLFAYTKSHILLIALTLAYGCANAAWLLARLSFISDCCAPHEKGRVIALMAGLQRGGGIAGPIMGGMIASIYGYKAALLTIGVVALLGTLPIIFGAENVRSAEKVIGRHHQRLRQVLLGDWRIFATAGVGAMGLMLVRGTQQLVIPLYGVAIGLDPAQIGLLISITFALEMVMFVPAGIIMDRRGRKWTAVPGTIGLAISLALLPLAQDFWSLLGIGLLAAASNGLSTGVLMAMGSDYSSPVNRGEFLGIWRLTCDVGLASGPLLCGLFISIASLSVASLVVAGLGVSGGLVMAALAPEALNYKSKRQT